MSEFTDRLRKQGAASLEDPQGRLILVARGAVYGLPEPSIVVAYEGEGCLVLRDGMPRNIFALIAAGFSAPAAKVVAELLNILSRNESPASVDQASTPRTQE